jgi:arginine/ornithine transport system permease protein
VQASLLIGLLLAIPVGIMRTSRNPLINGPAWLYTYCFTGTPLLIQLFLFYYGLGQFEAVRDSPFWYLLREAWFCALLTFVLNTAAYTAEILRGAIQNTPKGEVEAARACGMSPMLMFRRIILPSAFRRALPAYGNEIVFMLHGSSVASIVTIIDLTGAARLVQSRYYAPFEAFITAGACYLLLTWGITLAMRRLERSWFAHLRPRTG